jgi:hypothetical protein
VNELDAFVERIGGARGRRLQRALEVVEDRQQIASASAVIASA